MSVETHKSRKIAEALHARAVDIHTGQVIALSEDDAGLAEIGHAAQLKRQYSLTSVIALGCLACNTWAALAGTLTTGVYAGGPPLIIYGFMLVTVANIFVTLSLAELSSSYPTAGGPYHWAAAIAPPRYSRQASFITGYLNLFAYIVGTAGSVLVLGQFVIAMAKLLHPDFDIQRWMVFLCYEAWAVFSTLFSIYGNALMPITIRVALIWTVAACFVSIIAMAAMSRTKSSSTFVFATFINETGWNTDAIAALTGLLNPTFGFAAIDAVVHYAEEVKDPERNIPRALISVLGVGFVTGLSFIITAFYSVSDFQAVLSTVTGVPIVEMYRQATNTAGALGLTLLLFGATLPSLVDCQIATARLMWAFARDDALPFSASLKKVHPRLGVPVQSSLVVGACLAVLGCIYIGNTTAFNAFISSSILLNNITYCIPVIINMTQGRQAFRRGKFQLKGAAGWVVNVLMCCWVLLITIFFNFPAYMPVTSANMNYTCAMLGFCVIFAVIWWAVSGHKTYKGPVVDIEVETS